MFSYYVGDGYVRFWIDTLPGLSDEIKELIGRYACCTHCGQCIENSLEECNCYGSRTEMLPLLTALLEDKTLSARKFGNKVNGILGSRISRDRLQLILEDWRLNPIVYGGDYVVPDIHWEQIDPLRLRDQRNLYSRRGRENRRKRLTTAEGAFTKEDIAAIWEIQGGQCYFCSCQLGHHTEKRAFHIDHLEPISNGGSQWPSNLALTCIHCNCAKNALSEEAFWRRLVKKRGQPFVTVQRKRLRAFRRAKKMLDQVRKEQWVASQIIPGPESAPIAQNSASA